MLSKLLKYDFKALIKVLFPVYGVSLLVALLTRLTNTFTNSGSLLAIPNGFISVLFVIVLIGIPFITFILTIIKFYQNLIKDEGYLMHTLPVKKSSLVLSKAISACVMLLVSLGVSISLLFVGVYGLWFDNGFFKLISELYQILSQYQLFFWLTLVTSALGFITQQFMFYGAIALGQKHNSKKIVYSVIYLIVLYTINQMSGFILLIPMMFNPEWSRYLNSTTPPIDILNGYLIATIVISVLFVIAYYILTVKMLDKKLNLE